MSPAAERTREAWRDIRTCQGFSVSERTTAAHGLGAAGRSGPEAY